MTSPQVVRLPVRLSLRHKRWLYVTAVVLLASGLGWLVAHDLLGGRGEFGDAPHPSEPWWLRIHGAAAMGFLIGLGSLLPGHISRAWQMRRNHRSGLSILGMVALLIAARPWISCVHWLIGLAAAGMAPLHVVLGRRRTAGNLATGRA